MSPPDLFAGTEHDPDALAAARPPLVSGDALPALYTMRGLEVELRLSRNQLGLRLRDLTPDRIEGRTRAWSLHRVVDHLIAAERARWVGRDTGEGGGAAFIDPEQARARKDQAAAEKTQIEISQKRRELVSVADAGRVLGPVVRRLVDAARGGAERLAPSLAVEEAPAVIRVALLDFADGLATTLADGFRDAILTLGVAPDDAVEGLEVEPAPPPEPEPEPPAGRTRADGRRRKKRAAKKKRTRKARA